MFWSFALVNKQLAEIYYEMKHGKPNILGHCLVEPSEYKTKREQLWIKQDTKKFNFTWKHGVYTTVQKQESD